MGGIYDHRICHRFLRDEHPVHHPWAIQDYDELLLGPFLILYGIYLLDLIHLGILPGSCRNSSFSTGITAQIAEKGYLGAFIIGIIFAMNFYPFSAVLFFAMLIPLALAAGDPVIIPAVFAIATGLPVIVISYFLVTGVGNCSGIIKIVREMNPGLGERS